MPLTKLYALKTPSSRVYRESGGSALGSFASIPQPTFPEFAGERRHRVRQRLCPPSIARRSRPHAARRSSSERLDSAAVFGFPASRATGESQLSRHSRSSIHRVRASLPDLFSRVCPNPMRSPNHALQRTAPRVTARAFYERRGIYICAVSVRSTLGHAPRHAPPSLSLGFSYQSELANL